MIRVNIEMWPRGDKSRAYHLGTVEIANDGTGSGDRGNYMVRAARRDSPLRDWRREAVKDFPRRSLGPYDLLLRALVAVVGPRNRRVIDGLADVQPSDVPQEVADALQWYAEQAAQLQAVAMRKGVDAMMPFIQALAMDGGARAVEAYGPANDNQVQL